MRKFQKNWETLNGGGSVRKDAGSRRISYDHESVDYALDEDNAAGLKLLRKFTTAETHLDILSICLHVTVRSMYLCTALAVLVHFSRRKDFG